MPVSHTLRPKVLKLTDTAGLDWKGDVSFWLENKWFALYLTMHGHKTYYKWIGFCIV